MLRHSIPPHIKCFLWNGEAPPKRSPGDTLWALGMPRHTSISLHWNDHSPFLDNQCQSNSVLHFVHMWDKLWTQNCVKIQFSLGITSQVEVFSSCPSFSLSVRDRDVSQDVRIVRRNATLVSRSFACSFCWQGSPLFLPTQLLRQV